ncbi:MAG: hypothetical protein ACLS89_04650 [Collinsella sp.]
MTTKYTDAPRTRVMTPASLNNGVHENHSIGQTMAIAPKKGLFDDISIPQIIAGAAAAATSVALASKIGIAGSVIGAAVSSVITVVSSQVYRHFISASAEAIKGTHAAVDYPAGAYEPVEPDVEEHLGGAATTQEMRQVAGRATTARVAPNSLRAKAAAERSQTQKKVIVFSIAIAIVAVIACAGAFLITTAGGLERASRANPVVARPRRCKWPLSRRMAGTDGRHVHILCQFVTSNTQQSGRRFLYGQQWHAVRHDRLKPND